jgi:hypothetical protein
MGVLFEWYYIGGIIAVAVGTLGLFKRKYPEWSLARKLAVVIICTACFYVGMVIGTILLR